MSFRRLTQHWLRGRELAAVLAASGLGLSTAAAQPQIVSLGSGGPNSVTAETAGTYYIGGSGVSAAAGGRWTLTGSALSASNIAGSVGGAGFVSADGAYAVVLIPNSPRIFGNTATNVSPPFSESPTLVPSTADPQAGEFRVARWNAASNTLHDLGGLPIVPSLMVYGSGSSGGSTGNYLSPNAISANGRFIVGLGYISSYSSAAGTTISASTFQWRPWVWDAQANAGAGGFTILPTPFRTSTNTWRRRTGNPYAVSIDGTVIVGAQEHNSAVGFSPDPDGGRLVVWRLNSGSGQYEMTYLPNGANESGMPYTYSSTPRTVHMNQAGTVIVGMAIDNGGGAFLGKWTWDAGSSSWSGPANLGSNLGQEASWLPGAVLACGVPPQLTPTGMSDDGSTIVGIARYSTCGSFMSGGFIWTQATGIVDWYDFLVAQGVAGITDYYGPIGDFGDPTRGLPKAGSPLGISTDGNAVVGAVTGNQLIPGAPPWILLMSGGPGCVPAVITSSPANPTNFSACSSQIILNAAAAGTQPITCQWFKDGGQLFDGTTGGGSTISGATSFQLRVSPPLTAFDVGAYHVEAIGGCGGAAISSNAQVQYDPAFPPAPNDTCATAAAVTVGTNVLTPAQSPCPAFVDDATDGVSCALSGSKADRWFVFTPATSASFRLETCGSNYDTILTVFDACDGLELACNDNYVTGPTSGCNANRSRIASLAMTAGQPYYIRIAAPFATILATSSTMNLSINPAPAAAPNDACGDASIAVLGSNAFDTTEATADGTFVGCSENSYQSRDVWFQYSPPTAGILRAATCPGTSINTVLSIHDGLCGGELACNDNANVSGCSNQSVIENYRVEANRLYAFRVAGNSSTVVGAGVLTLALDCDADLDGNGIVDISDLAALLANFGCNSGCTADLNSDGITDLGDLTLLLSAFGVSCH